MPTIIVYVPYLLAPKTHLRCWIQAEPLNLSDPFPVIQYAYRRGIHRHKEFKWTQDYAEDAERLKDTRERFISKLSTERKMKFGIEVPRSIKHALELDRINGICE